MQKSKKALAAPSQSTGWLLAASAPDSRERAHQAALHAQRLPTSHHIVSKASQYVSTATILHQVHVAQLSQRQDSGRCCPQQPSVHSACHPQASGVQKRTVSFAEMVFIERHSA